jgi:hypothetical protein
MQSEIDEVDDTDGLFSIQDRQYPNVKVRHLALNLENVGAGIDIYGGAAAKFELARVHEVDTFITEKPYRPNGRIRTLSSEVQFFDRHGS